jgi:AcrR family transcriptional regulator
MSKTRVTVRLDRESIVDAAVRIAARGEPDGLTGKALGVELGVDRSAVWRHFDDRDALMRAVGDRLLLMALEQVPADLAPRPRLAALARAVVDVFVSHPRVGAELAVRMTWGPGEFAVVELMLVSLQEMGLSPADIVLYQRMLADAVLAFAGSLANYAVLSSDARAVDQLAWRTHYAVADPRIYPAISVHAVGLAGVQPESVLDALLAALLDAIEARVSQHTEKPRRP